MNSEITCPPELKSFFESVLTLEPTLDMLKGQLGWDYTSPDSIFLSLDQHQDGTLIAEDITVFCKAQGIDCSPDLLIHLLRHFGFTSPSESVDFTTFSKSMYSAKNLKLNKDSLLDSNRRHETFVKFIRTLKDGIELLEELRASLSRSSKTITQYVVKTYSRTSKLGKDSLKEMIFDAKLYSRISITYINIHFFGNMRTEFELQEFFKPSLIEQAKTKTKEGSAKMISIGQAQSKSIPGDFNRDQDIETTKEVERNQKSQAVPMMLQTFSSATFESQKTIKQEETLQEGETMNLACPMGSLSGCMTSRPATGIPMEAPDNQCLYSPVKGVDDDDFLQSLLRESTKKEPKKVKSTNKIEPVEVNDVIVQIDLLEKMMEEKKTKTYERKPRFEISEEVGKRSVNPSPIKQIENEIPTSRPGRISKANDDGLDYPAIPRSKKSLNNQSNSLCREEQAVKQNRATVAQSLPKSKNVELCSSMKPNFKISTLDEPVGILTNDTDDIAAFTGAKNYKGSDELLRKATSEAKQRIQEIEKRVMLRINAAEIADCAAGRDSEPIRRAERQNSRRHDNEGGRRADVDTSSRKFNYQPKYLSQSPALSLFTSARQGREFSGKQTGISMRRYF